MSSPLKKTVPNLIQAYLSRNPLKYKLESFHESNQTDCFDFSIVIPVCSESDLISQTLDSLLCSLEDFIADFQYRSQIIIVINNPALPEKKSLNFHKEQRKLADNQHLLRLLRNNALSIAEHTALKKPQINFFWIDASSKSYEVNRKQGVGGARKIGMDAAMHFLNWDRDPLILSLDADVLVQKNYISAVRTFFNKNPSVSGAVVDFQHQSGSTPFEEKAIRLYECYIHNYVTGIRMAASPYSYHSIGSTMISRAYAYIKSGGMRPRPAGEDFYFMQALCKVGQLNMDFPIGTITETCVYPSSRLSDRVPFGTGTKMTEYIMKMKTDKNDPEYQIVNKVLYNPRIFVILKEIISGVNDYTLEKSYDSWFDRLPKEAKDFFNSSGFHTAWSKIIQNTPKKSKKIVTAFHTWFDAFRILKFIHFCESEPYNLEKVCPDNLSAG